MNIQRVHSEMRSQVEPGQFRGVDMTISENGVSINGSQPLHGLSPAQQDSGRVRTGDPADAPVDRPNQGQSGETSSPTVTSTQDLQDLLNPAEIQALQEFRAAASDPGTQLMRATIYDGRGAPVRADDSAATGRLVDLIG